MRLSMSSLTAKLARVVFFNSEVCCKNLLCCSVKDLCRDSILLLHAAQTSEKKPLEPTLLRVRSRIGNEMESLDSLEGDWQHCGISMEPELKRNRFSDTFELSSDYDDDDVNNVHDSQMSCNLSKHSQ
ncbi:hypothetical protein LOD99_11354 [Oopsacas minuta]|uniref:Uncharacterized protein n=1 Tax=Oopsacas minuta TaxID=111878 RepID=A0AAV7K5J0_9METZ|nr:hypothetical protein LOD99_11354 [Oopsacas minuta]